MKDKLFKLFKKVIGQLLEGSIEQLSQKNAYKCNFFDGTDEHQMTLRKSLVDLNNPNDIFYRIQFQDIDVDISENEYHILEEMILLKLSDFDIIEKNRKLHQQEKLIDRLIEKL